MKIAIISYSFTGNNKALAERVARQLSADHIPVSENKSRSMGTIVWDMMFNRSPQVKPAPDTLGNYDLLLFSGPVWMGQIAAPLRAYCKHLKSHPKKYGFFSINGGADGSNPKLANELEKRTGASPVLLLDLHIADLLPAEPKPARKDTSAYRLNDGDVTRLADAIVKAIEKQNLS